MPLYKQKHSNMRTASSLLYNIHIQGDMARQTPAVQSEAWSRMLNWIWKFAPKLPWNACEVKRAASLSKIGKSSWLKGVSPRPRLLCGHKAAETLHVSFTRAWTDNPP